MNLLYANDAPGRYPDSWYAATATPTDAYPTLKGDQRADVCVVGGGYTGLSARGAMAGNWGVVSASNRTRWKRWSDATPQRAYGIWARTPKRLSKA